MWPDTALLLMLKKNICLFLINTLGVTSSPAFNFPQTGLSFEKTKIRNHFQHSIYFYSFLLILWLKTLNITIFEDYLTMTINITSLGHFPNGNIRGCQTTLSNDLHMQDNALYAAMSFYFLICYLQCNNAHKIF